MTVNRPFQTLWSRKRRGGAAANADTTAKQVPRVAKLMALAIQFDQLIRDGVVADQAELARMGRVTRARLTQIMDLLNLAPEIQEELLYQRLPNPDGDAVSERRLRPIAATPSWRTQRTALSAIKTAR